MACHNHCSGNYSLGSLRNPCHIPLSSSIALCPTNVSDGNVLCVPSSCQDRTWILNNGQETCSEPASCQPASCEPSNCETSSCPSTACYAPRPCRGISLLPVTHTSGSCLSVSSRPLNYVFSSGRPLSLLTPGYRPQGCLPCGPYHLGVVSGSLRPLCPVFGGCQPLTHIVNTCHPSCSSWGGQ